MDPERPALADLPVTPRLAAAVVRAMHPTDPPRLGDVLEELRREDGAGEGAQGAEQGLGRWILNAGEPFRHRVSGSLAPPPGQAPLGTPSAP